MVPQAGSERHPENLFDIEYLVFSSHKSATQTAISSMSQSGIKCIHCHSLGNIGLSEGDFSGYLKEFERRNGRKLKIISIFRDPLERLISSFFQWFAIGVIRNNIVKNRQDTIIYRKTAYDLQQDFFQYWSQYDGFGESIDTICRELDVSVQELRFSEHESIGIVELELCHWYLLRFDTFVLDVSNAFSKIHSKKITEHSVNRAEDKWYFDRYMDFRSILRIPPTKIRNYYAKKMELIEIFYPDRYEQIVENRIRRFCMD